MAMEFEDLPGTPATCIAAAVHIRIKAVVCEAFHLERSSAS